MQLCNIWEKLICPHKHAGQSCLPRHAVMEQRDPNAISGLLKLHLRENRFLSTASIQSLQNAMGDMVSYLRCQWLL